MDTEKINAEIEDIRTNILSEFVKEGNELIELTKDFPRAFCVLVYQQ